MEDTVGMKVLQAVEQGQKDGPQLPLTRRTMGLNPLLKIRAFDKIHHKISRAVIILKQALDANDIAVIKPGQPPRFLKKAKLGVVEFWSIGGMPGNNPDAIDPNHVMTWKKFLDRDPAIQLPFMREVSETKTALAQYPFNPKATKFIAEGQSRAGMLH